MPPRRWIDRRRASREGDARELVADIVARYVDAPTWMAFFDALQALDAEGGGEGATMTPSNGASA